MVTPDATAASLMDAISEARTALLSVFEQDSNQWWRAYEVKAKARNGWSDGVMNLALSELIESRSLEVDGDRVRLCQ